MLKPMNMSPAPIFQHTTPAVPTVMNWSQFDPLSTPSIASLPFATLEVAKLLKTDRKNLMVNFLARFNGFETFYVGCG